MAAWFSRLFRSRTETLAEKAEVEGRYEDAARLFVECGARGEAFRVLIRAAEFARLLHDRRALLVRAYTVAPTDPLQKQARKALGQVTLAECEASPPRTDDERSRLAEAAADLEAGGLFRDAGRAYKLLGDRESMERMLMLAGDVEGYEREAGAEQDAERKRLRRRNAIESFEALWRAGDRKGAMAGLATWVTAHPEDDESRDLLQTRSADLLSRGRFEARIGEQSYVVIGAFPVTFGREADVVVRGASVSREHSAIERDETGWTVRDCGSRNGTQLEGLTVAGTVAFAPGQSIALGADLVLRVASVDASGAVLEIDHGMDRGKKIVLVRSEWPTPLGRVTFRDGLAVLEPRVAVQLDGQKVAAAISLARGDRLDADGVRLEVLR